MTTATITPLAVGKKDRRTYSVNDDYFKFSNSNQPVVAGMFASDGCILDKHSGQKILNISFAMQDRDSLEFIKNELEFTGPINVYTHKNPNWQNTGVIRIRSDVLADDLARLYNVVPRKTYTLQFPKLKTDEEKIKFIAGEWIGDGNSYDKNRPLHWKITCQNKSFLNDLSKEVLRMINYSGEKTKN